MTRFALFGPVLLACLAALAGLWGTLDAYAQGLAVGAIYGGLALLGPMLLIGGAASRGAAGDELDALDDADELPMLPPPAVPALPPPPAVRVVRVERPRQKQLPGGNR